MKTNKNPKPIDIDGHLKYRCSKCSLDHWISLIEAQTEHFKIVCDCKNVFEPRTIKKIKIIFVDNEKKTEQEPEIITTQKQQTPQDVLDKCVTVLLGYGFTKQEATDLVNKTFIKNPTNNCVELIKFTLESLGVDYHE